jgi:hypothetical protein
MTTSETGLTSIRLEVSAGELIDKLTILYIKKEKIRDEARRVNILNELRALEPPRTKLIREFPQTLALETKLRGINEALWNIEDAIRECEERREFGSRFIELARAVYKTNDERAVVKRAINLLCRSSIVEEKSYNAK